MPHSPCNNRGASLLEVVIAMFLTTIGILAILSLQPSAWRTTARADYLGRASGILYKTLQDNEARIMNPCNAVVLTGPTTAAVTVTVTWPPLNNTGITESMTVTRQEMCRFPVGCPDA